jgi:hypothetical protein
MRLALHVIISGSCERRAIMASRSTTSSPGNVIIAVAGALGILSFFLPWFSFGVGIAEGSFSGLDIARVGTDPASSQSPGIYYLMYVVPLMGLLLLVIGGAGLFGRMAKTRVPAFIVAAIGLADLLYFAFAKFSTPGFNFFQYAAIGFWLTLLSMVGGIVGAFLARG